MMKQFFKNLFASVLVAAWLYAALVFVLAMDIPQVRQENTE